MRRKCCGKAMHISQKKFKQLKITNIFQKNNNNINHVLYGNKT